MLDEQKCANGRAASWQAEMWQWKSRSLAMEEQNTGKGSAALWHWNSKIFFELLESSKKSKSQTRVSSKALTTKI